MRSIEEKEGESTENTDDDHKLCGWSGVHSLTFPREKLLCRRHPMAESRVYADLHTHTSCSDGTLPPESLIAEVAGAGLEVVAVTDHDTTAGLSTARRAAETHNVQVVPGVELSVTEQGEEVHLLAYGIDPSHERLQTHLQAFQEARDERAWSIVERLREHGLRLDDGHIEDAFGATHSVGRPHVAALLKEAGHVETVREAFDRYLGRDGPGYVPKPAFPASAAMEVVERAGGISVLAHPGHWMTGERIRRLVNNGLDGVEVIHPTHDASLQGYYERLARGYDLTVTGGSDYHGRALDGELGRIGLSRRQWERCRARLT